MEVKAVEAFLVVGADVEEELEERRQLLSLRNKLGASADLGTPRTEVEQGVLMLWASSTFCKC